MRELRKARQGSLIILACLCSHALGCAAGIHPSRCALTKVETWTQAEGYFPSVVSLDS